jgi:hypothetical protein
MYEAEVRTMIAPSRVLIWNFELGEMACLPAPAMPNAWKMGSRPCGRDLLRPHVVSLVRRLHNNTSSALAHLLISYQARLVNPKHSGHRNANERPRNHAGCPD